MSLPETSCFKIPLRPEGLYRQAVNGCDLSKGLSVSLRCWVEMYKRGKSFTGIWESLVLTGAFGDFPFANLARRQLAFFENRESDIVSSNEGLVGQLWKPRFSGLKWPNLSQNPISAINFSETQRRGR